MAAAGVWRTLFGVVQFDPTERDVNGKTVLSVTIRTAGLKDQSVQVSCTLWPSHAHLFDSVEKGQAVVVEGKFSANKGTDKEGDPKTYLNLSVARFLSLGALDPGEEVETTDSDGDAPDDDAW